jgi:DNA-binding response OmpR family regulator
MGGNMGVESSVNVGTTIWVELPQAEIPQARLARLSKSDATTTMLTDEGVKYTALYVEDNLANLSLIESIFAEIPGLRLMTATEGEAGIQAAMEILPDLVILDIHLPDIPAEQVLARLKGSPRTSHILVIFVSADATTSHINAVLAAGAAHYLTKPLGVDRFLKVVKATLPEVASDRCN